METVVKEVSKMVDGYKFFEIQTTGLFDCRDITELIQDFIDETAVQNNEIVDWDINNYDTKHFVRKLYNMSAKEANAARKKAFSIIYGPRHMIGGSPGLRYDVLKDAVYCRFIAWIGNMVAGQPYHLIMDGIPYFTGPFAMRPVSSYRGESLTPDDLLKKESYLQDIF